MIGYKIQNDLEVTLVRLLKEDIHVLQRSKIAIIARILNALIRLPPRFIPIIRRPLLFFVSCSLARSGLLVWEVLQVGAKNHVDGCPRRA